MAHLAIVATIAVAGLCVLAATSSGQRNAREQPLDLVSLPALGTVVWRCGREDGRYGLGFRPAAPDSGIRVALLANGSVRRRAVLTSGDLGIRHLRARRQALFISHFSGAGTLRARVRVDFEAPASVAPPCYSYLPPRTEVLVGPRR